MQHALNESRHEDDELLQFINEMEGKMKINDSSMRKDDLLGDLLAEQASMYKNNRKDNNTSTTKSKNKNKNKNKKTYTPNNYEGSNYYNNNNYYNHEAW